jgi:hypothetical protein
MPDKLEETDKVKETCHTPDMYRFDRSSGRNGHDVIQPLTEQPVVRSTAARSCARDVILLAKLLHVLNSPTGLRVSPHPVQKIVDQWLLPQEGGQI